MTQEQNPKLFALDVLRREYKAFIEKIIQIPGLTTPKQQACFRFEEGHMWMQQAIIMYVEPKQPEVPQVPAESEAQELASVESVAPEASQPVTEVAQ